MLCVPRSASPVDTRTPTKGSPSSSVKSKLFARKDTLSVPKSFHKRGSSSGSGSASSDTGVETVVDEVGVYGISAGTPAISGSPVSVSKRQGPKWLDFVRNKEKSPTIVATGDVAPPPLETIHSGTAGHSNSGSIRGASTTEPVTKSFFSISRRPSQLPHESPSKPTITPSPLPRSQHHHVPSSDDDDETEEDEEEEEEDALSDDTALSMNSTTDAHPQPSQLRSPPPAAFYPSNRTSSAYPAPDSSRRNPRQPLQQQHGQPSRSHTNLLQLTTASLQGASSPHPLITPRSNGGSAASASVSGAPLFPRSSNLVDPFPRSRTVVSTLHKTRIIRRLESPGSLTAAEELSILPFATRTPGSRLDRSPTTSSIYPTTSSYRARTSLMRNLGVEDGDLMREVDVNAHVQGQGFPTFSKGLKRWVSRPSFEQRAVMWLPVATHGDVGVMRTAVHRPALKGPAPLVFSDGLEALAGIVRPRRAFGSWRSRAGQAITQVVAPLYHPKPRPGLAPTSRSLRQPEGLLIPSPPQLSSSPSSSASTDTAPNTPRSNSSSGHNLPSFVPPAFIRKLRQNNTYSGPDISDEDDVPLGVVVISKRNVPEEHRPKKDDPAEKARRAKEKAALKEKMRSAKDAAVKQSFKDQVLASRHRREMYRATGKAASLSEEWIEVDGPAAPRPSFRHERAVTSPNAPAGASSAASIRSQSQSSVRSRTNSARPPSIAASDRSRHSAAGFTPGMMYGPAGYQMPAGFQYPSNTTSGAFPPTFFVPPPPPGPSGSRRDSYTSSTGEFGHRSSQNMHQSMPNRPKSNSPSSDIQQRSLSRASTLQIPSTQFLAPPPRRPSLGVSETSSDNGRSAQTQTSSSPRGRRSQSSKLVPPRMPREIS